MKRIFTSILVLCLILFASNLFAQDTIVGWKFPTGSADSLADYSVGTLNTSRYISAQYGTSGLTSYRKIVINYTSDGADGSPDKCASATTWDNGADSSFWMVKFKTTGYGSIKLYSKQFSDATNPGPASYKIQYKLVGNTSPWVDITGGIMTCSNNWTSAFADGLDLPAACNNQTNQMSIRWLMTSNSDISGGTVASTGTSKIDDIIVTGTALSGVDLNSYDNFIQVYPNPNKGSFIIENTADIKYIRIFNEIGKCVYETEISFDKMINLSGFNKGIYFIQLTTLDNDLHSSKIIVE